MKKNDYDQELLDLYIELEYPEQEYGPITEEDRQIIADSIGFNKFCINIYWNALIEEIAMFPVIRWIGNLKPSIRIFLLVIVSAACIGLCILDGLRL